MFKNLVKFISGFLTVLLVIINLNLNVYSVQSFVNSSKAENSSYSSQSTQVLKSKNLESGTTSNLSDNKVVNGGDSVYKLFTGTLNTLIVVGILFIVGVFSMFLALILYLLKVKKWWVSLIITAICLVLGVIGFFFYVGFSFSENVALK